MHDAPYRPPMTQIAATENISKIRIPSLSWAITKWEYWLVPVVITFFGVLTAAGVEAEMERRGVKSQNPIARDILINYGLWVAVAVSTATFPIAILLLSLSRSAYTRMLGPPGEPANKSGEPSREDE